MTKEDIEVLASIDLDEYYIMLIRSWKIKRRARTPRIGSSRSDRLVMSQKRIYGSIGPRSRISPH
jgi:hypothetical protein